MHGRDSPILRDACKRAPQDEGCTCSTASEAQSPGKTPLHGRYAAAALCNVIAVGRAPAIQEFAQPGADREVIDRTIDEMLMAGLCARQGKPLVALRRPAAHHGVGDFGVKLDAVGGAPVTKRLYLESFAFGEQFGARRQVEAFSMPLIDDLRPSLHHGSPSWRDPDRVITDLCLTFRMNCHSCAKVAGQHLGAETNPKKRLALAKRHLDPFDLRANIAFRIVDAHRTTEDDRSCVGRQCVRQ